MHSAMDSHDCLGPAKERADSRGQVVERVAVLGEDDELASLAAPVDVSEIAVFEDRPQLGPLAIGRRRAHARSKLSQVGGGS